MRTKTEQTPNFWPVGRKERPFTTSPRPGPHPRGHCLPLLVIVRDILNLANNSREAKNIIKFGHVKVDQLIRKDHRFPAGLFDVISIDNDNYRVVPVKGGLGLIEISKSDSKSKLCKVVDKHTLKKGKVQLNLNDGNNLLTDKKIPTKSTLVLDIPDKKISKELSLKKGMVAMVSRGKNSGLTGKIKKLMEIEGSKGNIVVLETGDKDIEIAEDYVYVVGKKKPVLKLEAKS